MLDTRETILVTGAGGFVGGTIVEALYFGGRYRVLAGLSRWMSAPRVARLPITLVQCDILKPAELDTALAGVDYVIHCAVGNDKVIIDGTRNLLDAAAKAGVKRVVHISTVSVYGDAAGVVTEETKPPRGTLTDYGKAKLIAEEVCKEAKVEVVTLRPTVIYGPFSARWTMLYAMRLKAGWKHLGSLGMGKCNLVHVHDVARYSIAAIDQDGVVGEAFNVNGPEIVTWNEYLERFNQHMGLPTRVSQTAGRTQIAVRASEAVRAVGKYALLHHSGKLRWISHKSDALKHLMEQTELTLRLTTNPQELSLYNLDASYVVDKATRAFGFPPQVSIDNGLSMTVAWLNHMGEAA